MEKTKPAPLSNAEQYVIRHSQLKAEVYVELKSRVAMMLNDSFKKNHDPSSGYELSVKGAYTGENVLHFIVSENRSMLDTMDRRNIPKLPELFSGKKSIMADVVRTAPQYDLTYNEKMEFIDEKNGLSIRLAISTDT